MKRTILILIALSLSGMAQDKTLITNLTLGQFQAIVQEMGFTCTRGTQKDGKADVFFSFRAEGRKITGAINSERSDVAYLYSAFTDVTLPLDFYNDWNRENANAAYLERDNSSAISEIIVLTGGVTRENIEAHVRNFRDALIPYVRAALDRQAQEEAKGKK